VVAVVALLAVGAPAAQTAEAVDVAPSVVVSGIFADDLEPDVAADVDRAAVELGLRFRPDRDGEVTALQYYQGAQTGGVTTATLWSDGGNVLSRVSVEESTVPGWRTVELDAPVPLSAGDQYTVSYHAPYGRYPALRDDLTTPRAQNGFTLDAGAGVYRYGETSGYPTESYRGTNYLVDVVYSPLDEENPPESPTPPPVPPADDAGTIVLGRSFPNADTTGVPPGTRLTVYDGPCDIRTSGQVIDRQQVDCDLRIMAPDVVITDSIINGSVYADYTARAASFTITDSEVRVGDRPGTGIGDAFFDATRVEVTGGTRSINCYAECTVRDSYVHGQLHDPSGVHHESGIRFNTGSRLLHNTIACDAPDFPPDAGCSAAITGYPDFDPVQNNVISGNLIVAGSGGYCAYGGSTAGKPFSGQTRGIVFTDNVWQRGTLPGAGDREAVCGWWGPVTSFDVNAPGNVWRNNVFDDGTPVVPAN